LQESSLLCGTSIRRRIIPIPAAYHAVSAIFLCNHFPLKNHPPSVGKIFNFRDPIINPKTGEGHELRALPAEAGTRSVTCPSITA